MVGIFKYWSQTCQQCSRISIKDGLGVDGMHCADIIWVGNLTVATAVGCDPIGRNVITFADKVMYVGIFGVSCSSLSF